MGTATAWSGGMGQAPCGRCSQRAARSEISETSSVESPRRTARVRRRGRRPAVPPDARARCRRCRPDNATLLGFDAIEEREGKVVGIQPPCTRRSPHRPRRRCGRRRFRRPALAAAQLALADHAQGIVGVGADDAAGTAVVVRYWTVGEGVVGLLRIAVALHDQEQGFVVGALVAAQRRARAPTCGPRSRARPPRRAAPAPRGACRRRSIYRHRCRG